MSSESEKQVFDFIHAYYNEEGMLDWLFDLIFLEFLFQRNAKLLAKLSLETVLQEDMKLDGDNLDEFLYPFFEHFEIQHSNYDWYIYTHSEGELSGWRKPKRKTIDLKVSDLIKAVERGYW